MIEILPVPDEKLREIERSYPTGTIYTIYSLNLRFLFELDEEKNLQEQIEDIRLESKILTWIKARYLQKQFEVEYSEERKSMISSDGKSAKENFRSKVNKLKIRALTSSDQNEDVIHFAKDFVKELINLKGEIFYFGCRNSENSLAMQRDEINNLVNKLKDCEASFIKLEEVSGKTRDEIQKYKAKLRKHSIRTIEISFRESLKAFKKDSSGSSKECVDFEIESVLKKLDDRHKEINKDKRAKKRNLYSEIRKAEKFLASDEFGKFSEDPFFKISKDEERVVRIDDEECRLFNVSADENKLLEDGHNFSIFRGHLKDKWLNALTYKVTSSGQNASYFIRLSRLGLLQIRKEQHLGSNRPENITVKEEISPASQRPRREEVWTKNQNIKLISVLQKLLDSQHRYPQTSENVKVKDDMLQVAAGFAKLLEFKTNSNYSSLFTTQAIHPINIDKLRRQSDKLERQKYTLLLFTDIRKSKNGGLNISPANLDNGFPGVVSCILQGSLEKAERRENIKILQHDYKVNETGFVNDETVNALIRKLANVENRKRNECRRIESGAESLDNKARIQSLKRQIKNLEEKIAFLQGCGSYDSLATEKKKRLEKIFDDELEKIFVIPSYSGLKADNYTDLSTWENEICAFSPERGFIFFNDKETLESGDKKVNYKDYWKCIVRGVEYTVALRATLQLLESRTTRLLNNIPEILQLSTPKEARENDPRNALKQSGSAPKTIDLEAEEREKENERDSKEAEKKLEELTEDLASILKALPGLRSIAIPTNAFRSGHSVKKFKYLYNDCFNFEETIRNIQKNLDELTNFLTFFKQQQLQITLDKESSREALEDKKLSKIALLFTVASILYISVSFMQDFTSFFGVADAANPGTKTLSIFIYLLIFILVLFVIKMIDPKYTVSTAVKRLNSELIDFVKNKILKKKIF